MKQKTSRYNVARRILIFWTLFIGVGGKALHMDGMLPYFQVLPFSDVLFRDLLFSGFALIIVNGLTNLTAAVLLLKKKKLGVILGTLFGITLMLWICIQFYMFDLNFMSTAYFVFGFLQTLTGYIAYRLLRSEEQGQTAADNTEDQQ